MQSQEKPTIEVVRACTWPFINKIKYFGSFSPFFEMPGFCDIIKDIKLVNWYDKRN